MTIGKDFWWGEILRFINFLLFFFFFFLIWEITFLTSRSEYLTNIYSWHAVHYLLIINVVATWVSNKDLVMN